MSDEDTNKESPEQEPEESEHEEVEFDISSLPFPDEADPLDSMYQLWMAPTCNSVAPSEHLPTFLYVSAGSESEAALKAALVANMTRGIDCPCQVRFEEADLYV